LLDLFRLNYALPLEAINGGLFLSRGTGKHPDRIIDSYEFIFVTSGELHIQEEHQPFALLSNHYLILYPEKRHWGTSPFTPNLSFYWIHFRVGEAFGEEKPNLLQIPRYGKVERPEFLKELLRRFLDVQEVTSNTTLLRSLFLLTILCEIKDQFENPEHDRLVATSTETLANLVEQYIRTHFHEKISTSTIARKLGYNPDYLERRYKETFSRTISEGIQERRLRHASNLLLESNMTVKEIALRCGFRDCSLLRRTFKQKKGVTPSLYRRLRGRIHVNTA